MHRPTPSHSQAISGQSDHSGRARRSGLSFTSPGNPALLDKTQSSYNFLTVNCFLNRLHLRGVLSLFRRPVLTRAAHLTPLLSSYFPWFACCTPGSVLMVDVGPNNQRTSGSPQGQVTKPVDDRRSSSQGEMNPSSVLI
jgi:hypothetical protein